MSETVTLQIPEQLHQRLVETAQATQRTLESVILQAIALGSPLMRLSRFNFHSEC